MESAMKNNEIEPVRRSVKKESVRTLLILIASFACVFGIFQTAVFFEFAPIYPIYYFGTVALFLAVFFINRGFSRETPLPEQLPQTWDAEKKRTYIESDVRRKRLARKLTVVLVPFLLTIGIDIVWTLIIAE